MSLALDILAWLGVGLIFLVLTIIWVVIVVASVSTIMRFIQQYKKTSAELDREEAGDDGPHLNF